MEQKPNRNLQHPQDRTHPRDREPFGPDIENISPGAHVAACLTVAVFIVVAVAILSTLFNLQMFWLPFVFGWSILAFGPLLRGTVGLSYQAGTEQPAAKVREYEILGVLQDLGEPMPALAITVASSTLTEVDEMLKGPGEGSTVGYGCCVRDMIPIPRLGRRVGV